MDVQYTARARADTTEPFECAKCGYVGKGSVSVIAHGSARRGGMLFGNDRAGEMAADAAEARAWSEAMSHVALAACPRCGARDRNGWVGWLLGNGLSAVLVGGGGGLFLGLMFGATIGHAGDGIATIGSAVGGVIGAGIGVAVLARIKAGRTRRVVFDPPR